MSSARVCLQWTLIVYNIISVVLGVLAIVGTVYEFDNYSSTSNDVNLDKVVQIVIGSVLIFSGLVGCCAAASGSNKALCCFIVFLVALIVAHGWKLWRYNEQKQLSASEMLVTYNWIEELVKPGSMNEMQAHYKCCGKRGPNDYTSSGLALPKSCFNTEYNKSYTEGCVSAVKRAYLNVYRFEKWSHWTLIGYEVLGIWLSVFLICSMSTKTRRYEY